jgi:hypothetical protein
MKYKYLVVAGFKAASMAVMETEGEGGSPLFA